MDERWFAVGKQLSWYGKPRTYGVMPGAGVIDPFVECGGQHTGTSYTNEDRRDSGQRLLLRVLANPNIYEKAGEWIVLAQGPVNSRYGAVLLERLNLSIKKLPLQAVSAFLVKIQTDDSLRGIGGKLAQKQGNNTSEGDCITGGCIPKKPVSVTIEPLWLDILLEMPEMKPTIASVMQLAKIHALSVDK